jgi:hypothetical protein
MLGIINYEANITKALFCKTSAKNNSKKNVGAEKQKTSGKFPGGLLK